MAKRPLTAAERKAYRKLARAAAELREAQADADVLFRLPKTADGVRVGPLDDVWWPNVRCPGGPVLCRFELMYGMGGGEWTVEDCYSTKKAAIDAAVGKAARDTDGGPQ